MTWLSINPDSEPYVRQSAAAALAASPGKTNFRWMNDLSDPVHLANLYNNAEDLGLDLCSIKTKEPDEINQTALYEEHEEFFSSLAEAAFRDIEREDSCWTLTRDLLWSYNFWTKTYYDD